MSDTGELKGYPANFIAYLLKRLIGECTYYFDSRRHLAYHMRLGTRSEYGFRIPLDEPIDNARIVRLLLGISTEITVKRQGYTAFHTREAVLPVTGRFIAFYVSDLMGVEGHDQASLSSESS